MFLTSVYYYSMLASRNIRRFWLSKDTINELRLITFSYLGCGVHSTCLPDLDSWIIPTKLKRTTGRMPGKNPSFRCFGKEMQVDKEDDPANLT